MKTYLCGITSAGNYENLKEMIEPIKEFFDGLIWTFHYPLISKEESDQELDGGLLFLEENCKEGKVVFAEWCDRFFNSMNQFLWQGPMQDGDVFMVLDSMERVSKEFCETQLPSMIKILNFALDEETKQPIGVIQNRGKGFLYKYNEMLEFRGTPHTYPINTSGIVVDVTLPETDFWNVRAEQRDKFHWVGQYAKYMLFPAGSNHALLGIEHRGKPEELFPVRERARLEFLTEMKKRGYPRTVEGLKNMMTESFDDKLKELINTDKVWVDFYRYNILGERDLIDEHTWESKKDLK